MFCSNTGVEQAPEKSQHSRLTLEKKSLLPTLPGFELAIFPSQVWHSNQQAIPARRNYIYNIYIYIDREREYIYTLCEFQPKYITSLLKMAEVRKREEERRVERKVQKEREEEGNQFADKEAFVTSAYKKKMLEQQALEEKERREAAMEGELPVNN